ncbi:MAG: hypothetical protein LBO74_13480 [Candidatus Symbiothrix sp.]|nr:hypothetical protein [Candidatus Symbiothrix sp.]
MNQTDVELIRPELVSNKIIAYTVGMRPLTRKEFIREINLAREEGRQGNVISDEDLQKEIDTW